MKPLAREQSAYRIESFGGGYRTPTADLTALHAELLPESPIARLGSRFMDHYYYRVLPDKGLIFGCVAYVGGRPAGFLAATGDSAGFMMRGLRQDWPRIAWTVGVSVVRGPRSLVTVLDVFSQMLGRGPRSSEQADGELLSFGVREPFRDVRFVRETGIRISHDLLSSTLTRLYAQGARSVRAMVARDNLPTQVFYAGQGWQRRPSEEGSSREPLEFVHCRGNHETLHESQSSALGTESCSWGHSQELSSRSSPSAGS